MSDESKVASKDHIHCANCGSTKGEVVYAARNFDGGSVDYRIYQCATCHLAQTHPFPDQLQLSKAYSQNYYGAKISKFTYLIEKWSLFAAKKRAQRLVKLHGEQPGQLRILDIGCGRGVLLNAFRSLGCEVIGIERNDSPFEGIQDIVCGELPDFNFDSESFDIIVLWHVLEHLDEPPKILAEVARLLKKNGSLFISVPNFASFQAKIFNKYWFHNDLPRHLYHFNDQSLGYMLKQSGVHIAGKNTLSFDQNIYGFIQSALNMIPYLPNNHLYGLLKSEIRLNSLIILLIYSPLITLILIVATIELVISEATQKGASLNLQITKNHRD